MHQLVGVYIEDRLFLGNRLQVIRLPAGEFAKGDTFCVDGVRIELTSAVPIFLSDRTASDTPNRETEWMFDLI